MTLSRTDVGNWASSASHGTGSFATGSFTPPANSLLLIFVSMMGNNTSGDLGQPTISGGSLSYSLLSSAYGSAAYSHRINVFTATVGSSPSSMTITVDDDNNQNIYTYGVAVVAFTGYDSATPTAGVVTSGSTDIGDGSETQTLSATPTTNDVSLYALALDADTTPTNPTMASGWTKVYDVAVPGGGATLAVARRESSTSTTVTCTDVYTAAGTFWKGSMVSFIVKAGSSSSVDISGVGAIASSEVSGTPTISTSITPSAIGSSETFGSLSAQASLVSVGNIASAGALGSPAINATLAPSGIGSSETFGTPAVSVVISTSGVASSESIGTPGIAANLTGISGIAGADAVGAPAINTSVAPSGIGSSEVFGALVLGVNVAGVGSIASSEAFGNPNVSTTSPVTISNVGAIASAETFGTPVITLTIVPTGIVSSQAFGNSSLLTTIAGAGNIASGEAFGDVSISTLSPVSISNAGNISSAEAIGIPGIIVSIVPAGIGSSELFGAPTFVLDISSAGNIPSDEMFGNTQVTYAGQVFAPIIKGWSHDQLIGEGAAQLSGVRTKNL